MVSAYFLEDAITLNTGFQKVCSPSPYRWTAFCVPRPYSERTSGAARGYLPALIDSLTWQRPAHGSRITGGFISRCVTAAACNSGLQVTIGVFVSYRVTRAESAWL